MTLFTCAFLGIFSDTFSLRQSPSAGALFDVLRTNKSVCESKWSGETSFNEETLLVCFVEIIDLKKENQRLYNRIDELRMEQDSLETQVCLLGDILSAKLSVRNANEFPIA